MSVFEWKPMRCGYFLFIALIVVISPSISLGSNYLYHPQARELERLIESSLKKVAQGESQLETLEIDQINNRFADIDRGELDSEELIELKYLLSMYRQAAASRLVMVALRGDADQFESAISSLTRLNAFISHETAVKLLEAAREFPKVKRKVLLLLAKSGDFKKTRLLIAKEAAEDAEIQRLAGPKKLLPYDGANYSKEFGNLNWLGRDDVDSSSYQMTGRYSAMIRGIEVRSGDYVILDQSVTGGVNTNFSLPRSYGTHCGLIVFIEYRGKVYPAFLEIAQRGLRILPLNVVFSAPFTLYGEIYRPTNLAEKGFDLWAKSFGEDVWKRLSVKHYYDYYNTKIESGEEVDVVCSSMAQLFYLRNGISLPLIPDKVHHRAQSSLKSQFDFELSEYITPTSFLRVGSREMKFVGAIETGSSILNVARELVIGSSGGVSPESLGYLFTNYDLDLNRLSPVSVRQKFKALPYVAMALIAAGEVQVKAPHSVLAFAAILGDALEPAVKEVERGFAEIVYSEESFLPFSLHDAAVKEPFRAKLRSSMGTIRSWFSN